MKKNITMALAIIIAAISCQKESVPSADGNFVKVSFPAGKVDSRTAIDPSGIVSWVSSDKLSVFTDTDNTDGSSNYQFSVSSIDVGQKVAHFEGSVESNPSRRSIYAVYPYNAGYDSADPASLSVKLPSIQTAGKEADYALMVGSGSVVGDDFSSASVKMSNLCWIYDVAIDNSVGKTISAVYFEASDKVFTTAGSIDLTNHSNSVAASSSARSVRLVYPSPQSSSKVSARFVLLPIDCSSVDFNIDVVFEDESYERFSFAGKTISTVPGDRFVNSVKLGEGIAGELPKGYRLVSAGTNIATAISDASSAGDEEIKLWLDSSPSESVAYNTTSRINPRKSLWIKSDPANMKPTITIGAAAAISPKTGCDIETLHFENIIFKQSDSGAGDFLYIDTSQGADESVSIGNLEIENCEFTNFKYSLVRTSKPTSGGMKIDRIIFNNSIWTAKSSFDGGRAWLHLVNNADKMREIKITNSTVIGNGCLMYCNMNSSSKVDIDYAFRNCTFGNTKNTSSSNNYFISIVSGTLKGSVELSKNLFAGTNTLKSGVTSYILLREGSNSNYANTLEQNWYTASWQNGWNIDLKSKNYLFNFLTNKSSTDNSALVPGYASGDFTVTPGSDVYNDGIGDPRWIH